ncbi:hypothetical protein BGHDH14_bgh02914 [Blumeria hordei DH14]|uniref:Genetic interactor of prohibitins 3, mitochondrial n=1 Tax=Blumeria graminis f. sp. hordei (strain DH14) TaxID=546991 RepID=N1JHA1_BLUG1|nr:hypothetical protein BGHDH14_bgh02914 [Blumeria hordei DH14]
MQKRLHLTRRAAVNISSGRKTSFTHVRKLTNINMKLSNSNLLNCAPQRVKPSSADVLSFVCHGYRRGFQSTNSGCFKKKSLSSNSRSFSSDASIPTTPKPESTEFKKWALDKLPRSCPGCGALTQTINQTEPGFYNLKTHAILKFLGLAQPLSISKQDAIIRSALENARSLGVVGLEFGEQPVKKSITELPKCHRCRNLLNHRVGISINHPTIDAIRNTINETPFKYNHVYHIIDAADFPMSLIPGLHDLLETSPLRSKNRRSKKDKFYHGRKTEISFIITRADLLAPLREQVNSMMPYLRETLRDALGRSAIDTRLGNVHCVSAERGWWTKEIKEEVWRRGGGGWMVGKVNVGKSRLFNNIFPKGRKDKSPNPTSNQSHLPLYENTTKSKVVDQLDRTGGTIDDQTFRDSSDDGFSTVASKDNFPAQVIHDVKIPISEGPGSIENEGLDTGQLDPLLYLPPQPAEVDFPTMPIVSDLPGTTAAPIRIPFGQGRGELIDLPGLPRGGLDQYVLPEFRSQLVMCHRVKPEQHVIKPTQSLLLGGLIRITPLSPDIVTLAYAFTPIEPHLTHTVKAIGTQTQTRISSVPNLSLPGTGRVIASAGIFPLKWDVTKVRTGPITAHDAGRVKVEDLPYRVLATDILIEGCGWVEVVAQISRFRITPLIKSVKDETGEYEIKTSQEQSSEHADTWPAVEVFSPHGKHIAARRPMNAWAETNGRGEEENFPSETGSIYGQKLNSITSRLLLIIN